MMRNYANTKSAIGTILILSLFISFPTLSLFPQVQRSIPSPTPPSAITFKVSEKALSSSDSILQISLHSTPQEAIRLFSHEVKIWEQKNIQNDIVETGILLEDGRSFTIPRGELFFTYHNGQVFTESFRQSLDGQWQFSMLRGYRIKKDELILQTRVLDTLKQGISPKWYFADGQYILSPRANMASCVDSMLVMGLQGRRANQVSFKLIDLRTRRIHLTNQIALGTIAKLPFQTLKGFGIKEIHLTSDYLTVHSLFRLADGTLKHLFSGLDLTGNLLWEKVLSAELIRRPTPHNEFFVVENRPIIHQVIKAISAFNGIKKWERSLYDAYNTDPKFEYSSVNHEHLKVLEASPLSDGEHVGVILGRSDSPNTLTTDNLFFIFNRLGKLVYRYEISSQASHWRLYSKGKQLHIATERSHIIFDP